MRSKFFVELPQDREGNRSYTNLFPAVLEIEISEGEKTANIILPAYHAEHFKTIPINELNSYWLEVPGPARLVSRGERESMIVVWLKGREGD